MVAAVDHLQLIALLLPEQVKVVVDQIQLAACLLQAHGRHGEIFAPHSRIRQFRLTPLQKGGFNGGCIVDHIRAGGVAGAVAVAVVVIAVAFLPATQLAGQFSGGQIDAGVQVFTAFLGADHRAVGKDRYLGGLLRHPGIAGYREMDVGLAHSITEVRCGPLQLCLGVIPQCRRDLEVATMDQQLHASLLCRLLSAS